LTTPPPASRANQNKRWLGVAQIAVSAILLTWLLSQAGLRDVLNALAQLDGLLYALAGLTLLSSVAIRALRWYVLLTPLGTRVPLLDLFWLYLVGFFWNSFLPSGFGGDIVKAVELRRISQQGAAAVVSVVAERVIGLLGTCLIGLAVIAYRPDLMPSEATWFVGGMCLAIILGTLLLRQDLLTWVDQRVPWLRPVVRYRRVVALHETLRAYDLRALGAGLLTSVPFTLLSILDNYLVGIALGIDLGIGYYAIFTPIITIINLLPLSFNGLGVREATYQVLFGLVGISAEQAIAMALAFNLLRFGVGVLGGIVSVVTGMQRAIGADQIAPSK